MRSRDATKVTATEMIEVSHTSVVSGASKSILSLPVCCERASDAFSEYDTIDVTIISGRTPEDLDSFLGAYPFDPMEFGIPPRQNVHFLMTTGMIAQGQAALYVAETSSGKFAVYTMGQRPDGQAGVMIKRHDMVLFRQVKG